MIKIIKSGQREFHGYCDRCGCEFTYEFEDISISGTVECPTCGKHYYHPSRGLTNPGIIGWPTPGGAIPCNTQDPCLTCDWYNKMLKNGGTYVGDTPCTFCNKNKLYANTLDPNTKACENFLNWATTQTCKEYTTPCVEINSVSSSNFDDNNTKLCSNKSINQE